MTTSDDDTRTADGHRTRAARVPVSERYEITGTIGRGGMGEVLEARDLQFDRVVALKRLPPDASLVARERFAVEATVTGQLEHSGIPPVHERGELADGSPYYAMRRISGRTLAEELDRCSGFAERVRLVAFVGRIARTVAFAHERGVLHRDIKPANVILDDHGDVVLLDWGLAKRRDGDSKDSRTRAGELIGTPAYMAPEQAEGAVERVDARTDVFALGALLYHVLTGRPPYASESGIDAVRRASTAEFVPVRRIVPEVPVGLATICERAMDRDPARRYASAIEMAAALDRVVAAALVRRGGRIEWFAAGAMGLVGLSSVGSAVALMREAVPLSEMGLGVVVLILTAVVGFVLLALDLATAARHRLGPLVLACSGSTLLFGFATFAGGLGRAAGNAAHTGNAERFDQVLLGLSESAGTLVTGAGLAALLLLAWAVARRRELTQRG